MWSDPQADGTELKLLELAADGAVLNGFTTDVAGIEFVRNALDGLGNVVYEMPQIERFLDYFAPLFNPDNVEPSPMDERAATPPGRL